MESSLISEQNLQKSRVVRSLIYLGLCFLLLFSSELTYLNLVSQIYDQYSFFFLGNITVFALYLTFGIFNIFAPNIIEHREYKYIMILCSGVITIFISSGVYVSFCKDYEYIFICSKPTVYTLVILLTLIVGCFGALIWVANNAYIDDFCQIYPESRGYFFGIFYGIMTFSQGLGALFAWVLLQWFSQQIFFIIMSLLGFLSFIMMFFLTNQIQIKKQNSLNQNDSQNIFIKLQQFKTLLCSQKIRYFLPFFYMGGVIVAFYTSFLHNVIKISLGYSDKDSDLSEDQKQDFNIKSTFVFITLGFSQAIAGFVGGKLLDIIDFKKMIVITNCISTLAIIFSFLSYFLRIFTLCFVCAIFWGFSDSLQTNISSMICSKIFNGKLESFAIFRFIQGFSVAITISISLIMQNQEIYLFIIVILGFQILCSALLIPIFKQKYY